jgi:hypothetical protein
VYDLAYQWTPKDTVSIEFEREYGYFDVSPRSLDLGIRRASNRIRLNAGLGLPYTMDAWVQYDTFSDGNRRWEVVLGPRRSVLRTEHFNLDVGLQGWWFGFDEDLDHGYYDPGDYQRYSVTFMGYVKLNDNSGISLFLSPGAVKDEDMPGFRFGMDASVEATFGIFSDWMLVLRYAHFQNNRFGTGAYRTNLYGIYLTRRF